MKKSKRQQLIREIKLFSKVYLYTLTSTALALTLVDRYNYKDNIYYHNELKLNDEQVNELEEEVSSILGEEISIDDNSIVLGAAMENDDLTEEEKETIYRFTDLLEDNPYLDKSNAYNNLRKLDIKYDEDADFGQDVIGVYINSDHEITIIEDNNEKETMLHELVHCIYSNNYITKLPKFLNEGMTELLTNEYFEENPFKECTSYPYEILMVKILCELVGEDKVLETYSTGDITIIEEELRNRTHISEPKEFIENLDTIATALEENEEIDSQNVTNIISFLDSYYENNFEVDSSEYAIYLYNRGLMSCLYEKKPYSAYFNYLMSDGYYVKAYFSSKLKDKYKDSFKAAYFQDISSEDNKKVYIKYSKNKKEEDI